MKAIVVLASNFRIFLIQLYGSQDHTYPLQGFFNILPFEQLYFVDLNREKFNPIGLTGIITILKILTIGKLCIWFYGAFKCKVRHIVFSDNCIVSEYYNHKKINMRIIKKAIIMLWLI